MFFALSPFAKIGIAAAGKAVGMSVLAAFGPPILLGAAAGAGITLATKKLSENSIFFI